MTQSGDNIRINAHDISNAGGQQIVGKARNVTAHIAPRQEQVDLTKALQTLQQAVLASTKLPDDEKQEHVAMIKQASEEVAKPQPNKVFLKMFGSGLLTVLKLVPDVTEAVNKVIPLLSNFHL